MNYLLILPLFGLLALLPACGNGSSKTASSQARCCDNPGCRCPAPSEHADCCSKHSCACQPEPTKSPDAATKEKLDSEMATTKKQAQ